MLGRPLSRHHVLFISICCGCGIAGRLIASEFCSLVNHAVDYCVSPPIKGNKGGSYEEKRVFP